MYSLILEEWQSTHQTEGIGILQKSSSDERCVSLKINLSSQKAWHGELAKLSTGKKWSLSSHIPINFWKVFSKLVKEKRTNWIKCRQWVCILLIHHYYSWLPLVFECGPQSRYRVTEKQSKMKLMMIHYEQRHTTQVGVKHDSNRSVCAFCFDKCCKERFLVIYWTVTLCSALMFDSGSSPLNPTSLICLVINIGPELCLREISTMLIRAFQAGLERVSHFLKEIATSLTPLPRVGDKSGLSTETTLVRFSFFNTHMPNV